MMDLHNALIVFSKSFGLFYLIALSVAVLVYTFWPANKKWFDQAARNVVSEDDRPCL